MKVETILDQIELGSMALPEFRGGYVWNRDQVRGLAHSLYAKHPVGSLLVWVTKTEAADARGDLTLAKICAAWPDARSEMNKRLSKWKTAGCQFKLDWFLRNINAVPTGEALFTAMKDIDAATFCDGLQTTDRVMDRIINLIASRLGLDHDRALGSRYSISLMRRCFIQRVERLSTMPNGTGAFSGTFTFFSGVANLVRPRVG